MLETLVLQPIFNLLLAIYGLIPGHDFGLALIFFTLIVKLLLWKRTRKQFESSRKIRELQPEITKIKKANKEDKRAQQLAIAELYKRNEISPLSTIGNLLIQIPIIIGLFQAVRVFARDDNISEISRLGYGFVNDMPFVQRLIDGSVDLEQTFFGIVDLSRTGYEEGVIYWPLVIVAVIAAATQYLQARQVMATTDGGEKKRGLREILRDEAKGNQASQSEITAAATRSMTMFMPGLTFFFGMTFPGAVAFYWMASNIISFFQQRRIRQHLDNTQSDVKVTYKKAPVSQPKSSTKKAKKKPANSSKKTANRSKSNKPKRRK